MNKILLGIMVIVLVALTFFVFFKPNNSNGEVSLTGETKEFDVVAKKFAFEPSTITVDKGDKVILNIESIDVTHGISIPEFNVNSFLEPGETVKIEFIANKQGEFDFFCNVYCGSGHNNMQGVLVIK